MVRIAEPKGPELVDEYAVQGPQGGLSLVEDRAAAEKQAAEASKKGGEHVAVSRQVTAWEPVA